MTKNEKLARGLSRRQFLSGASVAAITALAGCQSTEREIIDEVRVRSEDRPERCEFGVSVHAGELDDDEVVVIDVGGSTEVVDRDVTWWTTPVKGSRVLIFRADVSDPPGIDLDPATKDIEVLRQGYISADCEFEEVDLYD